MFNNIFSDKTVLITGHTGFKGSWLVSWLLKLGAKVHGLSKDIPTDPSMFEALGLEKLIGHNIANVIDGEEVERIINKVKPDFVFHLAAQPIVSISYKEPIETIQTNVLGTANVLEALKKYDKECCVVLITSDKCYYNAEWSWGYRETDQLGGKDIYSGSKAAAEMVIRSYIHSFFADKGNSKIKIAVGRAGNVVGGGDWAVDRIVVDCVKSWSRGAPVTIRSPRATRPWQHVLEPLSGYLLLAQHLLEEPETTHGECFNFGPRGEQNKTVLELISDLVTFWEKQLAGNSGYEVEGSGAFHEAGLLKLCIDKAMHKLLWKPTLEYAELITFIGDWYQSFYSGSKDLLALTNKQIAKFENKFSLLK